MQKRLTCQGGQVLIGRTTLRHFDFLRQPKDHLGCGLSGFSTAKCELI